MNFFVKLQVFHSDYFSGWDHEELQYLLDECENDSEAANPDAFCNDYVTFRPKPKQDGVQVDDDQIRADLETIQPDPVDIKGTICAEDVTNIPELKRGACNGDLIGASGPSPSPPGSLRSKRVFKTKHL